MKVTDLGEVLARARAGDDRAVARLYRTFQPQLLRYLRHEAGDAAEDLASETWIATARALPSFEGDIGGFRGLLFTIARRRLVDHYRTTARRPTLVVLDGQEPARTPDTADVVVGRMTDDEALAALTRDLPPDQAEVVLLRVVGGLSVDQVAAILGKSAGAVRMLQLRALQKLQKSWPGRDAPAAVDD